MKVKDFMKQSVYCIKPDTNITEIAKVMNNNHIGCVPVCDTNNILCGILTDRDILLRAVACNKDLNSTIASDIMTTRVYTCKKDEDIKNAENIMAEEKIRRLPVCDERNHVIGILTFGDLAQKNNEIGNEKLGQTLNNICNSDTNKNNM